ncbi:MAG: hypothetical protein K0R93_997 [Anaerosolibacter sp.]|uniref:LlaJI family restriction endonuclease n=1 Tax=Anaerosolibacter sp. TaxID=1872527 RepID=UPI0026270CCD|nr:LlaJI family restriction endonuclease [Anaerosolibacter sp.]MDF2546099.1 hypothetical protein [Anaerosolibacter sp.]
MSNYTLRQRCFVELVEYSTKLYSEILDPVFFEKNICRKKGVSFSFNVTGFLIKGNHILVVFPKGYKLPDEDEQLELHVRTLAETLARYRSEEELEEEEKELLGNPEEADPEGIAAAIWLISDYENNGYIRKEIRSHRSSHGANIDWPRTVRKMTPLFSKGSPIYPDVLTRRSRIDYNNLLYQLHMYAVQRSYEKYGWILGWEKMDTSGFIAEMPCDRYVARYILQRELEDTFVDREMKLINILMEFIIGSGEDDERIKLSTLATPYFHYVWEKICGHVFLNRYKDLSNFIPKPRWNSSLEKSISQRPDLLYVEDEILYILDAKYYDVNRNLPGWHDLVKQFYYYFSMHKKSAMKVRNALIFPGVTDQPVEDIGYVDIEDLPELGQIRAFCIDTYEAMRQYGRYGTENFRERIKPHFASEEVVE